MKRTFLTLTLAAALPLLFAQSGGGAGGAGGSGDGQSGG